MCLGIPMKVLTINGHMARCTAMGLERDVSLYMLPEQAVQTGDYVIVHVGYAIQKLSPADGQSASTMFNQALKQDTSDHA